MAGLALAGCGVLGGSEDDASDGSAGTTRVAKIGVIAPGSGDLSALGLGVKNAVDLAVKEANEDDAVPGWTLQLEFGDDQGTPDVGKEVATRMAADGQVVGVVGTLVSAVAQSVQPVLDPAHVVMVSPANTTTSLTRGPDPQADPTRPHPNYFRTCTTDAVQGAYAARYLYRDAGVEAVATVAQANPYGEGLVAAFTEEYESLGGTIATAETISADDAGHEGLVSSIGSSDAGAVYFGGDYPQAGRLAEQLRSGGVTVPLMGGDGIYSPEYIELAGRGSGGDLATSVGAPVDSLESATPFVEAYEEAGYQTPFGTYGVYAYDAANAIIAALEVSLPEADTAEAAREPTVEAMAEVSFDGATGPVAFDEYGDTTTRLLAVYEVRDGAWVARDSVRVR